MKEMRLALVLALTVVAAQAQSTTPHVTSLDLTAIDRSADPCVNFYQFACGNWMKKNPIPADQSRWGRFDALAEQNRDALHAILEKAARPSANRSALEQKIGDFYASCMDEKAIEEKGIAPLRPWLDRIATLGNKSEIPTLIAEIHNGVSFERGGDRTSPFFVLYTRPDAKRSTIYIATFDQGGLGLPDRDYYLKTDAKSAEERQKYEAHVRAMFQLLEASPAVAEKRARTVLAIETALASASLDRVARRNPDNIYHAMALVQLEKLSPSFAWRTYLTGRNLPLAKLQTVNVATPDFFRSLDDLLAKTSLEDLKVYLTWHIVHSAANSLPEAFVKENFDFYNRALLGMQEMRPRWSRCVALTDRALGEALGQKFVETAFGAASKQRTLEMVHDIEKAMAKDIQALDWMSPATKQQAVAKLHAVSNKIGYPERWRDYSSVRIVRGDYYNNVERATQFETRRQISRVGEPVDKSEWSMTPPTVNAYYNPSMNNINFPAGILQPPFFDEKIDDAVNYGAIGAVIGHELTHGFDDQGRRYDGEGNLRDWWTAEDAKAFQQRADCIVNLYGGFTAVADVKLNGRLTLGENAADNGGVRLAYMALMEKFAGKIPPPKDGYTAPQRFFLGYGQIWCQNQTDAVARYRALTDPHSPGQYRVNGVLQNMPEFQQAFGCKAGQPMVADQACRVW